MANNIAAQSKENLVIFVHGFLGKRATWDKDNKTDFKSLLLEDEVIKNTCDICIFDYYTKIITIFDKITWPLKYYLYEKKYEKNIPIKNISKVLFTDINVKYKNYKNIFIVAHSMGGLIAKAAIIKSIEKHANNNIKTFFSLAVPHNGSTLANYGHILLKTHPQVKDLKPLEEFLNESNQRWIKLHKELPDTIYFVGENDNIVPPTSAEGYEVRDVVTHNTFDDHFTMTKPKNKDSVQVREIVDVIKNTLTHNKPVNQNILNTDLTLQIQFKQQELAYYEKKGDNLQIVRLKKEILNLQIQNKQD